MSSTLDARLPPPLSAAAFPPLMLSIRLPSPHLRHPVPRVAMRLRCTPPTWYIQTRTKNLSARRSPPNPLQHLCTPAHCSRNHPMNAAHLPPTSQLTARKPAETAGCTMRKIENPARSARSASAKDLEKRHTAPMCSRRECRTASRMAAYTHAKTRKPARSARSRAKKIEIRQDRQDRPPARSPRKCIWHMPALRFRRAGNIGSTALSRAMLQRQPRCVADMYRCG